VAEDHEVTPQSDYVFIYSNGYCFWEPRYELSISQCIVDETWFPFDEQICKLVFYSWLLTDKHLILYAFTDYDYLNELVESEEWEFVGT